MKISIAEKTKFDLLIIYFIINGAVSETSRNVENNL